MQVNVEAGISQGLEIGISDCEYSARRRGIRHLYVQLHGTGKNMNALDTCTAWLRDDVLTDSLIIEPPTRDRCTSATRMIRNDIVEVVDYMRLAECRSREGLTDMVPPTGVVESSLGGYSPTSLIEEIEIATDCDTDTDECEVTLAAGSANQSFTAQPLDYVQNVLHLQPSPWRTCYKAQSPEEFAFLQSTARLVSHTQVCVTSASTSSSGVLVVYELPELPVLVAPASAAELEVQAFSKVT